MGHRCHSWVTNRQTRWQRGGRLQEAGIPLRCQALRAVDPPKERGTAQHGQRRGCVPSRDQLHVTRHSGFNGALRPVRRSLLGPVRCQGCAGLPRGDDTSTGGSWHLTGRRRVPDVSEVLLVATQPAFPGEGSSSSRAGCSPRPSMALRVTESCPSASQPPRGACGSAAPAWGLLGAPTVRHFNHRPAVGCS